MIELLVFFGIMILFIVSIDFIENFFNDKD